MTSSFKSGVFDGGQFAVKKFHHKKHDLIPNGYVLIKQSYISLGQEDLDVKDGFVGLEGSGVIEYISGKSTRKLKHGDRVCYNLKRPLGSCEYLILHEKNLISVLDGIDMQLACFTRRFLTAHYLLHKMFMLQKGMWVGISGASGVLGQILTKWAKYCGLNVVALVGSDAKIEFTQNLGANASLNYNDPELVSKILKLTNNYGLFVFYDLIGGDIFDICKDTLSYFGKYVLVGSHGGDAKISTDKIRKKSLHFVAPSIDLYKALYFETIIGGMDFMHFIDKTNFDIEKQIFNLKHLPDGMAQIQNRSRTCGVVIDFLT